MSQKKQKIKDVQNIYQAVQKTKLLASYSHIGILKGIQNTTTNFYSAFKPEIEYIAQSDTATEHKN